MMKENYLNLVEQADNAELLNALHADAVNDPTLHSTDKDEICWAIRRRFGVINAAQETPPKSTPHRSRRMTIFRRKVLPLLFFIFALVPPMANSQAVLADGAQDALLARRLAALSMIETGNDDNAHGHAGEVSRYQIMPGVWQQYAGFTYDGKAMALDPRNPFTARNIATAIMRDRCRAFAAHFHQPPNNLEFYLLWARPAWPLAGKPCFSSEVQDRALRFNQLVKSNHQL